MSRAEERALEAYPVNMTPLVYQDLIDQFGGKTEIDVNTYPRCLFQQGYGQAEKDLALTWEDVDSILNFYEDMKEEIIKEYLDDKTICEIILKRFKEKK